MKNFKIISFLILFQVSFTLFSQVDQVTDYDQTIQNATKTYYYNGVNYEIEYYDINRLNIYIRDKGDSSLTFIKRIDLNECVEISTKRIDFFLSPIFYKNKIIVSNYNFTFIYYLTGEEDKIIDFTESGYLLLRNYNNYLVFLSYKEDSTSYLYYDLDEEIFTNEFNLNFPHQPLFFTTNYAYVNTFDTKTIYKISLANQSLDTIAIDEISSINSNNSDVVFISTSNNLYKLDAYDSLTKIKGNINFELNIYNLTKTDSGYVSSKFLNDQAIIYRIDLKNDSIHFIETHLNFSILNSYFYKNKIFIHGILDNYFVHDIDEGITKKLENINSTFIVNIDSISIFMKDKSILVYNILSDKIDTVDIYESNRFANMIESGYNYEKIRKLNGLYYFYYLDISLNIRCVSIFEKKHKNLLLIARNLGLNKPYDSSVTHILSNNKLLFYNFRNELIYIDLNTLKEINLDATFPNILKTPKANSYRALPYVTKDKFYFKVKDTLFVFNTSTNTLNFLAKNIQGNVIFEDADLLYLHNGIFNLKNNSYKSYYDNYGKFLTFKTIIDQYIYLGDDINVYRSRLGSTNANYYCKQIELVLNEPNILFKRDSLIVYYDSDSLIYSLPSGFNYSSIFSAEYSIDNEVIIISYSYLEKYYDIHFNFKKMITYVLPKYYINKVYANVTYGFNYDDNINLKQIIITQADGITADSLLANGRELFSFNNQFIYLITEAGNYILKYNHKLEIIDSIEIHANFIYKLNSIRNLEDKTYSNAGFDYFNSYKFFKNGKSLYVFDMINDILTKVTDCNVSLPNSNYYNHNYIIDSTFYFFGYDTNFNNGIQLYSYTLPKIVSKVLDNDSSTDFDIILIPNPVQDVLEIQSNYFKTFELYDINGRLVTQTQEKRIDMTGLPTNTYILMGRNQNGKIKSKKIIKF